jgi:hypothetical protein
MEISVKERGGEMSGNAASRRLENMMLSARDKHWVVRPERAIDLRGRSRNNTRESDGGNEARRA